MFLNTVKLVEECDLTFLHVFPFSPRTGTPAARMPQVEKQIIKERAKILRNLGEKKLSEHFEKLKNKKISVIVENDNRARTDSFAKVSLDRDYPSGEILNMIVTGKDEFGLIGKVVA